MPDKVEVAVVGLGSIALKAHLPVLAAHPAVEVVGLASRTGAHIGELAAQYRLALRARTFTEVLSLRPRAAYLLTDTRTHPELGTALLEAGIAVHMEKPLALDLEGARQLADAAQRPGRLLMVGFNRRHAPAYLRARSLFAGRRLELVQLHKHRNGDHSGWSLRQVVMDDTIHIIDLARFLAGSELQVQGGVARPGLVGAQLTAAEGTLVQLSQTFGAGAATERVELHGEGLSVVVEEMERMIIRENGRERIETVGSSWTSTLEKRGIAGATEHFLKCLSGAATPEASAAEALATQELAEALLIRGNGAWFTLS